MTDELIKRMRHKAGVSSALGEKYSANLFADAAALIEQQAAALEAANARIAELEAERDAMMSALAECRDAMPIPDAGAPIEGHWASAMADPLEVPGYIRAALAQPLEAQADARDARRYRWLRDTLHGAKAGGGVEVNDALQIYEKPEPGKEVRVYWYQDTPVGFYESEASTLDEAIDAALSQKAGEQG